MRTEPVSEIRLEPGPLRMPAGLGEHPPGTALPIGPLVRRLAERLDQAGISWVVLRNAEGLPDFTRYDLDVLVEPSRAAEFVRMLEDCACENGWRIAGRIRKRHYTCLLLMRGSVEDGLFFLPIDLFTALEYRGLRYLDAEQILRERVRTPRGIWVLPPGVEGAITLLKELFPHGVLKENSPAIVQFQAQEDAGRFQATLAAAAGMDLAARLCDAVRRGEWSLAPADQRDLRRAARRHNPGWRLGIISSGLANFSHLFRPSLGMVVCLAGADGSGKTTLAQGLFASTFKRPFKACRYLHGNIGLLPRFRDVRAAFARGLGRSPAALPPEPQALKGMMEPLPAWKSIALAIYYAIDLWLARLRLRRWRGQWALVIMDRSFYDYYYQLGHRRCPRWVLDLLSVMVPKPDLLFCIEGDPEQIHARKPELTVEEIRTEQDILRGLMARLPFARRVDGAAGIEAMVAAGRQETDRRLFGNRAAGLRMWSLGGRSLLAYAEGSRAQRRRALALFPRTTAKRVWLYRAVRMLMECRLERRFSARCESPGGLLSSGDLDALLGGLRRTCGADVDWLLTWPAQIDRHRLYLVFRARGANAAGVVKIGGGEFNLRQLRNEANALAVLSATEHPFSIPAMLFRRDLPCGRAALALGGFPARLRPVSAAKIAVAGPQIAEYLRKRPVPAARMRIRETDWFRTFQNQSPSVSAARLLLDMAETEVEVGCAHGDLGPGNMLDDGQGGIFLFDWENASAQAPVLTDELGFWLACRQGAVLRDPTALANEAWTRFAASSEADLLAALGFLCAHGNLAAGRILEYRGETRVRPSADRR